MMILRGLHNLIFGPASKILLFTIGLGLMPMPLHFSVTTLYCQYFSIPKLTKHTETRREIVVFCGEVLFYKPLKLHILFSQLKTAWSILILLTQHIAFALRSFCNFLEKNLMVGNY